MNNTLSRIKLLFFICLFWGFLIFGANTSKYNNESKIPSPVILIPGDGGSRSYSYVDDIITVKRLVWVNFIYMFFPSLLKNVFKLQYDPVTHKTRDMEGSRVFFPGWGSTETIEELDEYRHFQTTYFAPLVASLMEDKYFVRNKTIRGAPYDFRKAPNENENFVPDMKKLIEDTYAVSNNQRVVIVGHSLGALYSLLFLDKMTVSWKQQYVRAFISLAAPFAGAVKAISLETSGSNLGSPRDPIYFREMQRSFPSTAFLMPNIEIYGDESLVITPKRNYSANDYKQLFEDMSMPYGYMMYTDSKDLVKTNEGPDGIDEIYCIHGYGVPTPKQLVFTSFPDKEPQIITGDGDSTVNIQSLNVCEKWKDVRYLTISGADHMRIVESPIFLNKLKQILYRQPNRQFSISQSNIRQNFSAQFF